MHQLSQVHFLMFYENWLVRILQLNSDSQHAVFVWKSDLLCNKLHSFLTYQYFSINAMEEIIWSHYYIIKHFKCQLASFPAVPDSPDKWTDKLSQISELTRKGFLKTKQQSHKIRLFPVGFIIPADILKADIWVQTEFIRIAFVLLWHVAMQQLVQHWLCEEHEVLDIFRQAD